MVPLRPASGIAADRATELAAQRTTLAVGRNALAAERTLMAWIRTSLSMISFGFTIVKFFEYLEAEGHVTLGWLGRSLGPSAFGTALTVIGTVALIVAIIQYYQVLRRYREQGLARRWSLTMAVAGVIALLGVYAIGVLILRL